MIRTFIAVLKALALFTVVAVFSAHALLAGLVLWDEIALRSARQAIMAFYSRLALKALDIRVQEVFRVKPPGREGGKLIVSNHLSYIDVLVIASVYPAVFVTSVEVRDTFFLGQMARLAGSLFVERRDRTRTGVETEKLSLALRQGFNVVLFPEATSSNGDTVLPFRRSFFASAVAAGSDVLMLCMKYTRVNGHPVDAASRDSIYYYGDLVFLPQLLSLLRNRRILVELRTLEVARHASVSSRDALCERAFSVISESYRYPAYQSSDA